MKRSRVTEPRIGARVLRWYDRHGRKDLPWKNGDPYHVWLSEIMLQQTQVVTVIPYFARFIKRFPTIHALAHAGANAVLHQWSGLGYYARARNLHRAAKILAREHSGRVPREFDAVASLPGIGRSTAGAILAQAYGQRHPILDGNVKRVLARYHAIGEPLAGAAIEQRLWKLADYHTPRIRAADYTQAIMDLGATLCRRTQPLCAQCPVRKDCVARAEGRPTRYPRRRARKQVPTRSVKMLLIRDERGHVLLQRRPPVGLWGGLWGLPESRARDVREWSQATLGLDIEPQPRWPRLRHSFSHFHLDIHPIPARLVRADKQPAAKGRVEVCKKKGATPRKTAAAIESLDTVWYNCLQPDERGLAAPVKRLLDQLRKDAERRPSVAGV